MLYEAKEKTTDKYNEINSKIDEKYSEDVEKATKMKKYFKGAMLVIAILIICSTISMFSDSKNLGITPEEFQQRYDNAIMPIIKDDSYAINGKFIIERNEKEEGYIYYFQNNCIELYINTDNNRNIEQLTLYNKQLTKNSMDYFILAMNIMSCSVTKKNITKDDLVENLKFLKELITEAEAKEVNKKIAKRIKNNIEYKFSSNLLGMFSIKAKDYFTYFDKE